MVFMTTGETIRRIRKSAGMTQAELGALIHFTQPAVSNLEHDGLQCAVNGTAGYPRERAAWQIRQAQNSIRSGAIAEGCDTLTANFDGLRAVASTRLQTALGEIVDKLRSYSSVPEARTFLEKWMAH